MLHDAYKGKTLETVSRKYNGVSMCNEKRILSTLLDNIGNTPLLKLNKINRTQCEIYVKLESQNPAGSIKDRIALYMIDGALATHKHDSVTLVEPTSGNTGIALALLSAVRGYRCILTMPESMSVERQKLLRAYGAELVLTPAHKGMQGAVNAAEELCKDIENALYPNQFANPQVLKAHYKETGPEILAQCKKITQDAVAPPLDALVAGIGTGGTLSGSGLYLREHLPNIRLVAVEPAESPLLSEGRAASHGIQGIGANFIPPILRRDIFSEIKPVSTEDALQTSQSLFKEEGISCGISSGANVYAALRLAARPEMKGKRIVTFICDGGERYISTALFDTSV